MLLFAKFNFLKLGKFLHILKRPSLEIELYDIFNSFIYWFSNLEINSLSKLLLTSDNFFELIAKPYQIFVVEQFYANVKILIFLNKKLLCINH